MKKVLRQIPNVLTIIRLLLIPIIVSFIFEGKYLEAFIVFTISAITDVLDGFIARKFDFISNFGRLVDPLADKLTHISVLTSLVILRMIPTWILIIVALKELTMIIGASFLYGKDVVVYSKWYGKLATVLFYLAIVISLITKQFELPAIVSTIDLVVYSLAVITTIFSLVMYMKFLYQDGFINKSDLNKQTQDVVIKDRWKKK